MSETTNREKALEATRILNYLLGDLMAGWHGYAIFHDPSIEKGYPSELRRSLIRMSLAWLALALAKWGEFYDNYRAVIPLECAEACKRLRKDLRAAELRRFRNTMVGHIFDAKTGQPVSREEMRLQLDRVMGQQVGAFLHWIKRVDGSSDPATAASVVDVVEMTRDRLIDLHKLREDEIFERADRDAV